MAEEPTSGRAEPGARVDGAGGDGGDSAGEAGEAAELSGGGGNYEVIRQRLVAAGTALHDNAGLLNERRKATFGGSELAVIANERVRTDNNCVPRDIQSIGDHLLLGYNVFIGLKSETAVSDVFALHRFAPDPAGEGYDCSALPLAEHAPWLCDAQFVKDFQTLYRYYRDARLLQLVKTDTRLLAVFQIGASHREIKVFRWRIDPGGALAYMDDRGVEDYVLPRQHDFAWVEAGRERQVAGKFPHVNIADTIFVETTGGDLTVKIEDNTASGEGIYAEPVDDINQGLDDAQFFYADLGGLILLKILPFRETRWRYLVFCRRTAQVVRIDAIGQACVQLPEDHGILFPGGYFLATGDHKVFEGDTEDLELSRTIASPNGEDVLYLFHRRSDGHYALLPYNLIRKEVQSPLHCHGYSLFADGRLIVFRSVSDEPTRVHPMQLWQTPFTSAEFAASAPTDGSFLAKVGNADLVRGISDAFSVVRLIRADAPTRQTYEDIIATCSRLVDTYYWLGHADVGDIKHDIEQVRRTAELIVDEFEKVQALKRQAAAEIRGTEDRLAAVARDLHSERWNDVKPFMDALTALRTLRGHIITLREVRYIDTAALDALDAQVVEHFDRVSRDCVRFLLRPESLSPLRAELEATLGKLDGVTKVADATPLRESVDRTAAGLDLLSDVVSNLQIEDATQRTEILERISEVYAHVNRVRATVEARHRELRSHEGRAEFGAQFRLLGQSVAGALAMCDTPERCDEELSRIMVQLEELEGKFSDLDEFMGDLAAKRDEIYEAFGGRKQTLADERARRAQNIIKAGERILEGVGRRARALASLDEVNGYFASDAMVMKLHQLADQLVALGDSVKADELAARLKAARQDALRGLRDKLDLYEAGDGGAQLIALGRHRFSVNAQPLELTMVQRDGEMSLHLTGTDFYQPVADEAGEADDVFEATRALWTQDLVSETEDVYRAEYLAASLVADAEAGRGGLSVEALYDAERTEQGLAGLVRGYAQERYDEGYERGIHDADAAAILDRLLAMRETAGLLRFAPAPRVLAALFWAHHGDDDERRAALDRWHLRAASMGRLRALFRRPAAADALTDELAGALALFARDSGLVRTLARGDGLDREPAREDGEVQVLARTAAEYLALELAAEHPRLVISAAAVRLRELFMQDMELQGARSAFERDLDALATPGDKLALALAWIEGFLGASEARRGGTPSRAAGGQADLVDHDEMRGAALECAASFADGGVSALGAGIDREPSSALTRATVTGLLGHHGRVRDRQMTLQLDEFGDRLGRFVRERVPAYRAYRALRGEVLARERARLRIDELVPRVMTAFVRNKLINEVYLPLVGDNLAKQMGAAGAGKRTDLMGMLLLISPPGYGKTTLMEYIANRLGLVFVKINGPSLGHTVHSLDPAEAPNATARQEVEKLNLALEMGNNVMLYVDDIQHTHPEFLQKFISLCDAQRKIEGVWRGRTRTYDMRGKKFCVVMAGNPYTESGESFQIPDMLANRADVYNLGDILSGKDELFALSYIENALTSNPALSPLATRDQADVYKLVRMARGEEIPALELSYNYAAVELNDIRAVLRHLMQCQEVLLAVNRQYIVSAAQDDRYRTEPPFKLQGSYRNMNKLAEKIVPAMTAEEVAALIDDHYVGEAQTLTTEAEQNLLKLAELRGRLTGAEAARWAEIKAEYVRLKRMGGADDPVSRVTGTLTGLAEELSGIRTAVAAAAEARTGDAGLGEHMAALSATLDRLSRPEISLEVATAAPEGLDRLLSQQVAIVEKTLVPLVATATRHLEDSQVLGIQLRHIVQTLEAIDLRLRRGAPAVDEPGADHGPDTSRK